jgi:hypothetical protein
VPRLRAALKAINSFECIIRIFSPESVAQHNVKVSDYASLDNHMDLVIFGGWYDKENRTVMLDRLIKEAV